MKYTFLILFACLWGIFSAWLAPQPYAMIIAILGGGVIGWQWNNWWKFIGNNED